MQKKNLSRRDFIKISLTTLWGAILAACKFPPEEDVPPIATTTPTSTSTSTPTPTATNTHTQTPTETPTPEPCFSLLEPLDKAELGNIGRIAFAWETQKGASTYKLVITLPNDLVEEYETEFTRFEKYLESLPMAGEYHWQVIAYNVALEEICVSENFTFTKVVPQKLDGSNGNTSTTVTTTTTTSNVE